jgi:histidine triad (HIT) family protein
VVDKDCIFCRIIAGEVPSDILHRDDEVVAIRDINPQAPTHLLILPIVHVASLAEVNAEQKGLLGHMVHVATQLARAEGIAENGYRLVISTGPQAGQLVAHLHLHLLGGRQLGGLG